MVCKSRPDTTLPHPSKLHCTLCAAQPPRGKSRSATIRTNKPGVKVSWQVTGIRQDAWANAHRIPTEEEKAPELRGTYLHPDVYGAGKKTSARLQAH